MRVYRFDEAVRCAFVVCFSVFCGVLGEESLVSQGPAKTQTLAQMYHSGWTIRTGAPSSIEAIAQTTDGYLWIGTDTGLYRFDGKSFERYHPSSGEDLFAGTIPSLLATKDGGLWISYGFAGASFLKQGHNVNYGKSEGLTTGAIHNFAEDKAGRIYASGNTDLLTLDGARWRKVGEEAAYPSDHAANVFVDSRGTLWAGDGRSLWYLNATSTRFASAGELNDESYRLAESPNGTVWISVPHSSQVRELAGPDGRLIRHPASYPYRAKKIIFDRDGSLWVSTDDHGLYRVEARTAFAHGLLSRSVVQHFSALEGLTSNNTFDLMQDREGSTWIASTKGLDQFRPATLTGVSLPPNWFRIGIAADGPESILAAAQGLVHISSDGSVSNKGKLKQIACLYRDPHGTLWIGEEDGLQRYSPAGFKAVPLPPGLDPLFHIAEAITMDRAGGLWVSFLHTGFVYYKDGRWTKPSFPSAAAHDPGLFAYTDSGGAVWFGLKHNRMDKLSENQQVQYGPESGIDVEDVVDIYERGGLLWVGGTRGLDFRKANSFHPLHLERDAVLEGVSGILQTSSGELWINQASGILRVAADEVNRAIDDPEHRVRFTLYNSLDGMTDTASQIRPNPTIVETSSGRLYFASRTGVGWIDPQRPNNNLIAPRVFVQAVIVDGKCLLSTGNLELPVHANSIEIDYTATSLLVPERVRFQYKLENFDKDWLNVGIRRQAFYSGLPPGRYKFRVRASNNDGIWNETDATAAISIPPSFLQSLWFKLLCALSALTVLALLYRIRVRFVTNRVKTRLYERLTERERIARDLHDTFFQGIQGLLLRFNTATSQLRNDEPARQLFEETLQQSDQVMLEGRELVLDLRTGTPDVSSLSEAFFSAGTEFRKGSDAGFQVIVHGEPRDLHPIVFEEAYKLGREALGNAFRHAEASLIEAEVNYEASGLSLRFRDNGVGLESKVLNDGGRENHWGLPGMRERAHKIGAQLAFWSRKGAGTEIELRIPAAVAYRALSSTTSTRWWTRHAVREDGGL